MALGAPASYAILAGPYVNQLVLNSSDTVNGNVAVGTHGSILWNGPKITGNVYEASGVSGTTPAHASEPPPPNYTLNTAVPTAQSAKGSAGALATTTSVSGGAISIT